MRARCEAFRWASIFTTAAVSQPNPGNQVKQLTIWSILKYNSVVVYPLTYPMHITNFSEESIAYIEDVTIVSMMFRITQNVA